MEVTKSGGRYLELLPKIVEGLNDREMPALCGLSPNQAVRGRRRSEALSCMLEKQFRASRGGRPEQKRRHPPRYSRGDRVRIYLNPGKHGRSYSRSFSNDVYEIAAVETRIGVPQYALNVAKSGEPVIGTFRASELQLVDSQ